MREGGKERILITGARGWFGRTAVSLLKSPSRDMLLTGSSDSILGISGENLRVQRSSAEEIAKFAPNLVIDCAFLTRDHLGKMSHSQYVEANLKLIEDSVKLASLNSVEKYIGFSSGAAVHLAGQGDFSLENNPYGALKKYYEDRIVKVSREARADISIPRVWSVSGGHTTKPELFAFSNLIMQARTGHIDVTASRKVFRRFVAIEDVIRVALMAGVSDHARIFDTGGELVEIGELAEVVRKTVNPKATIRRPELVEGEPDNYYSDGKTWNQLVELHDVKTAELEAQILQVLKQL